VCVEPDSFPLPPHEKPTLDCFILIASLPQFLSSRFHSQLLPNLPLMVCGLHHYSSLILGFLSALPSFPHNHLLHLPHFSFHITPLTSSTRFLFQLDSIRGETKPIFFHSPENLYSLSLITPDWANLFSQTKLSSRKRRSAI
jgi:hypothetical protein